MQGKTVIAIAHRLSTIARMDRIVVPEAGAIAEQRTHAELLARGGLHPRFRERQSGGFINLEAAEQQRCAGKGDPNRIRKRVHEELLKMNLFEFMALLVYRVRYARITHPRRP